MVQLSLRGPQVREIPVHHQGGNELDYLDALQRRVDDTRTEPAVQSKLTLSRMNGTRFPERLNGKACARGGWTVRAVLSENKTSFLYEETEDCD